MTKELDALKGIGEGASVGDFANALVHEFKGPAELAREVVHQYHQLPDGSVAKARILQLLVKIWAEHGSVPESDDPEELEAELRELEAEEAAVG